MDQSKVFKTLTVILLIANVSLMSVLLYKNFGDDSSYHSSKACHTKKCEKDWKDCHKEKSSCSIKKGGFFSQLDLDSAQKATFKKEAKAYKSSIKEIRTELKETMKLYFSGLKSAQGPADKEALMQKIQALQRQKIEIAYAHFESLKSQLRDDQKQNFDRHIDKAMKCILAKGYGDCKKEKSVCDKTNNTSDENEEATTPI
jgi:hypothetical protein